MSEPTTPNDAVYDEFAPPRSTLPPAADAAPAEPTSSPGAPAPQSPLQPDASGDLLTGIDLSAFQSPKLVDWGAIRRDGHCFAILRATYGTHPDVFFAAHVAGARAAGLAVGGYAFYRQTQPVEDQLAALVAQYEAAGLGCGDIVPAIDLEWNTSHDGQARPALYNDAGRRLVETVADRFGAAIVYIAPGFWSEMGHPAWVLEHAVWVSDWTKAAGPVWPEEWALWQFTNNYQVRIPRALRTTLQIDESRARSLPRIP